MVNRLLTTGLTLMFCICGGNSAAQNIARTTGAVVAYQCYDDGLPEGSVSLSISAAKAAVRAGEDATEAAELAFVDYGAMKYYKMLTGGSPVTVVYGFRYLPGGIPQTETIRGWECKTVDVKYRGDVYRLWYTDNLGFNGTAWPELGVPDGLVLRVERNGRKIAEAVSTNQAGSGDELFPSSWGEIVSGCKYKKIQKERLD